MLTLKELIDSGTKLTPMMCQYVEMKNQLASDTLLMFRMGDFYEMFFEDAVAASKILNIALTHRGKLGETPIPMAGIPHHAASSYIDKITTIGRKAAICEQIEDPKFAKGIVKRAITQIVSPGLPYDVEKSSNIRGHFLASTFIDKDESQFYLVLLDYTTGEFKGSCSTLKRSLSSKLESILRESLSLSSHNLTLVH